LKQKFRSRWPRANFAWPGEVTHNISEDQNFGISEIQRDPGRLRNPPEKTKWTCHDIMSFLFLHFLFASAPFFFFQINGEF
jgi:hypothetical protein